MKDFFGCHVEEGDEVIYTTGGKSDFSFKIGIIEEIQGKRCMIKGNKRWRFEDEIINIVHKEFIFVNYPERFI